MWQQQDTPPLTSSGQELLAAILSGQSWNFDLPAELEAGEPPEARGLRRDEVRLMVSYISNNQLHHGRFHQLPAFLEPGDLLVINTSGTLNAAVGATRANGHPLEIHFSTRLPGDLWTVELRQIAANGTRPFSANLAGERLALAGGGVLTLHAPYRRQQRQANGPIRLWLAMIDLPLPLTDYLARHGFPIRYRYVQQEWPLEYYQTIYTTEPGSAEMPSAGRAFTAELMTRLVADGVQVAPLLLHTGVASLEAHEPPYEEYYRVPAATAQLVNMARAAGRRIIAVGTTAVRALETVTDTSGMVHPGQGWTDLVITPERGLRAVTGLLTGLHEPCASHLAMLAALSGRDHLKYAYNEALKQRYLWHEFGDLHLILP
jgi:S-adenosylmethionine:tRNA ribosyltransferase-isomerase